MELPEKPRLQHFSTFLIVIVVTVSLLAAGLVGYSIGYSAVQSKIDDLQKQLSATSTASAENITYIFDGNVSLSQLYSDVKESVVVIRGQMVQYDIFHRAYYSEVQGSGFVYNFTGHEVVVTNFHVVESAVNITVTFADGNGYEATVVGSDPYEDLAVLSTTAPVNELKPLEIASSTTLKVGDPVIAVGNPYGLAGSMTTGIVSALGRTMTEDMTGGYPIASVIQTSTPINPGNSGGPLLNYKGQVVGITTAIVSNSQGLGFAIPSNSILREIYSLVTTGSYNQHPSLGVTGTDMTYEIAQAMGTNVTYGWLIATVSSQNALQGGTSQAVIAGSIVTVGGDIIIAINGTRITNLDDLSTYLEERTLPGRTINVTVVRDHQTMTITVVLGARPPPNA
jgi:S1-C subfamily serine protease